MTRSQWAPVNALLAAAGLAAFVWLLQGWRASSTPLAVPLLSKCAFVVAVVLYSTPALVQDVAPAANLSRVMRLRQALLNGFHWFLLMLVVLDVPLPSAGAFIWLVVSAIFGSLAMRIQRTDEAAAEPASPPEPPLPAAPEGWAPLIYPGLVWGVAAVFALVPLFGNTATALFVLILTFSGGLDRLRDGETIRWAEVLVRALGAVALWVGLFSAV